ncbi:hypothetical protein [Paractinoplanes atraurantiacus]|uniref:Uncharacterized protein n=1 Tax=Paractinoplanes atraurantiacus TaxID=1036182 RepID=A0A285HXK6_9ACTN|nr:hypothetical protein [Actinoplanes atraurantiacus]SNY40468.1 hypothetical protein SAMN05421748_10639 [Actinoplanes atraurantiacus]
MSVQVHIPAQFVATGWGTPTVCARHGQPAVEHKKTRFISRVQGWAYLLLLAGALPFLIFVFATRKTVESPAWPFCAQCAQRRKKGLTIGLSVIAVGVLCVLLLDAAPDNADAPLTFLAILAFLAGYIIAIRGANRMIVANGQVHEKGQFVSFPKAHEAFAAQATQAQQAAAHHHATQAAYHHAAQLQTAPPQPAPFQANPPQPTPFQAVPPQPQPYAQPHPPLPDTTTGAGDTTPPTPAS